MINFIHRMSVCLFFCTASAPVFFHNPVRVIATLGKDAFLECKPRASPKPRITWKREDRRIQPNKRWEIPLIHLEIKFALRWTGKPSRMYPVFARQWLGGAPASLWPWQAIEHAWKLNEMNLFKCSCYDLGCLDVRKAAALCLKAWSAAPIHWRSTDVLTLEGKHLGYFILANKK